jgi:signal transduction histidine kinase
VEARIRQVQADNAASMGRIAAALSHELNNPLGALKSSVSSLVTASEKSGALAEPRIRALQRDLAGVALQSAARLEDLVRRMQRFTNLDRAEVQRLDIRRVIEDVAGLCMHKNRLRLDLPELPAVVVQPQAISGALAALLQKATDGEGDIIITAHSEEDRVLVHIRCAIDFSPEPAFGVQNGRMAALNWDLFSIRQLVRSQGGDLVPDASGVTLALPAEGSARAARAT